ncbi:MAG: helix-turn-helix domain-containing protein [Candidatus Binatia bacterium]
MTDLATLRVALERAVAELPAEQMPDLIGVLATASARAQLNLVAVPRPEPVDVVDVATLAAELNVAASWLRSQARANKLPHLRCGKYIRFARAEVLATLARSGADHRTGHPAPGEKPNNGAGSFPPVSTQYAGAADGN